MFGLADREMFLLAVLLYGASSLYSIFLWRKGFREDDRSNYILLLAGAGLHTMAMARRGFSLSQCPVTNLYEATLFVGWAIVAVYLIVGLWPRLRFLGVFASPIMLALGVFALMPQLDVQGPKPQFVHGWSSLHASLILLAYGSFGLGSVAALMYLSQSRDLKLHKLRAVFSLLPPIQRLELVVWRLLVTGFVLLTIGLVLGAGWLKHEKGMYVSTDPKILWSAFVWVMYLALLLWRWRLDRGGRRFAWGALGGFAFVILTFWCFNLWSGIHRP